MRSDNTFDFEGFRSRQGQAEAILVAYDVMEIDEPAIRPESKEYPWHPLARIGKAT
jgi:hypothetical protein